MFRRAWVSVALIVALALGGAGLSTAAEGDWVQIGTGVASNISGLAATSSGWVVARDNKLAGQNRIAVISPTFTVTPLTWPGTEPIDLESIAGVPTSTNRFITVTSAGHAWMIRLTATSIKVIREFQLPEVTRDVEAFALTRMKHKTVAIWATRGSTNQPASIFAATFDPATTVFGSVSAGQITVPFPDVDVRQVTDLAMTGRVIIGSAASDPGNDGPFASGLYDLGSVRVKKQRARLNLQSPLSLGTFDGHKIEGVACAGSVGLLGTDDEAQGSYVRTYAFCDGPTVE